MRVLITVIWLSFVCCAYSQAWFDHVRRPSKIPSKQLEQLAVDLRLALKNNKKLEEIAKLAPQEAMPRVVFITIGGDKWPGRTYYGTGVTFQAAFKTAVEILQSNEPVFARETVKLCKATIDDARREKRAVSPEWHERMKNPDAWDWLRLDVVQFVQNVPQFSLPRSHVAMTSLCGIAFPPSLGFAFTPEQITGRCLINQNRTLNTGQICDIISEAYNWGALKDWMNLTAKTESTLPISLFETDTFYADAQGSTRLYRGHRMLYDAPAPEQCLDLASACADRLNQIIQPDGKLNKPFPIWYFSGKKETEDFDVRLETAIALLRLNAARPNPNATKAAINVLRPLIRALAAVGPGKRQLAVKEGEPLPETAAQVPRTITTVRTNALLALAMDEMSRQGLHYSDDDKRPAPKLIAERLADYLSDQVESDGLVLDARFLPSGKLFTDDDTFASIEDAALTALAIHGKYPEKAKNIMASVLDKCDKQPIETLLISPWVLEALPAANQEDRKLTIKAIRFAYAAEAYDITPLYPDMYGAVRLSPGYTFTARRTWALTAMSRWLHDTEKEGLATERVTNMRPMLIFHLQGYMDNAASSALPSPILYRGLFRDNMEEYSFNLEGQASQIMALVGFAQEREKLVLPPRKFDVAKARAASDVHPGVLQVVPVFTQDGMDSVVSRNYMGTFSKVQSKKGRVMPKQSRRK